MTVLRSLFVSSSPFERLAHVTVQHKWLVIGCWAVLLVGLLFAMSFGRGSFATNFTIPGSEAQKAADLLRAKFPAQAGSDSLLVFKSQQPLSDGAVQAEIAAVVASARQLPEVTGVISPLDHPTQISKDGHIAFATVQYGVQASALKHSSANALVSLLDKSTTPSLTVEAGGQVVQQTQGTGMASSEVIGIVVAAIILLIAFGSVVAMGLPIVAALVSLGCGIALVGVAAHFMDITSFTPSFAAMIGLGVGIDYALLVITRFREALHSGRSVDDSVAIAVGPAGRSVLFAGTVVIIAMAGLLLIGIPFIGALGVAAAIVVALSVLAALTLLPASLAIIGKRVDYLSLPFLRSTESSHHHSVWHKLSIAIQKRPLVVIVASVGVLLLCAAPVLTMQTSFTDAGNDPPASHTRRAYDLLSEGFGKGFNGPITVAIDATEGGKSALPGLERALSATPGVVGVSQPIWNAAGDTAVLTLYPSTAPQSPETAELVHTLRADVIPPAIDGSGVHAYLTGATAATIDVSAKIDSRTPFFFAMVLGLSFLVLMMVFRSVLVPLKAAIMNLFSIGAAYGILVAIFQWGWFARPLGVQQTGPIESFLPMMLFAIVFGLSMDYEVFLVSRIREEHLRGKQNSAAVAYGLSSTARVITSAALIMIAVFASFALGSDRIIKEFGLGLSFAVFIDATLIRLLLVPATMEFMGRANWWLPRGLDRLLPHINIDGPQILDVQPVSVTKVGGEAGAGGS
jgi:RND superfamily putative drug exporter